MDLDNNRWKICKSKLRELLPSGCGSNWLDALLLVKITSTKVIFAGIPHELHRLDIKNNHEAHLKSALADSYPEFGAFGRKKFEYLVGSKGISKLAVQEEFLFETQESKSFQEIDPLELTTHKVANPVYLTTNCESRPFKNFVICEFNQLAFKAAEQILVNPAKSFNPFLIYGNEGTGKTYLLQALAEEWLKEHPDTKLIMLNAENFLNQFIQDIRKNQMGQFREKFRNTDILILEDVQVLSSSPQCQQELKHTISSLKESGKQVILSANNLPSRISGINSTLANKLESGLSLDLPSPDRKSCLQILQSKAKDSRIELSDEICQYLVDNLPPNICQLEGVLIRLGAHSSLMGEQISLDLAKKLIPNAKELRDELAQFVETPHSSLNRSEEDVIQHVCNALRLSLQDIKSGRRDQRVIKGRQYIVYILTEDFGMSLSQIGQFLGRSHSTIHNALKKAQKSMAIDDVYRRQVIAIRKGINSGSNEGLTRQAPQTSEETLFNFNDLNLKTGSI